ncbi:MAG: hypothetical protein ACRD0P_05680 [Stackebrandtia sp.]
MTQPYQYDPSQQPPGPPPSPYDPAAGPPSGPPATPFDPAQQPAVNPGQQASSPFGPSSEPPMFPPPSSNFLPPQPPKKSKSGMFIVLGIVVLLLIGGGIGVAIWRPWAPSSDTTDKADSSKSADDEKDSEGKDSKDDGEKDSEEGAPTQVVDDAWHAKDWNDAKSYMCSDLVTKLEEDGADKNYQPIGADEEFEATDEKIDGDKATVTVETTVSADGKAELGTIDVELIKEGSDWKICEIGEPQ